MKLAQADILWQAQVLTSLLSYWACLILLPHREF